MLYQYQTHLLLDFVVYKTGLQTVSQAIQRQDSSLNKLSANTQADMAKAIMFNGYLFQMFQSQQKQEAGREGLLVEKKHQLKVVRSRSWSYRRIFIWWCWWWSWNDQCYTSWWRLWRWNWWWWSF